MLILIRGFGLQLNVHREPALKKVRLPIETPMLDDDFDDDVECHIVTRNLTTDGCKVPIYVSEGDRD